MTKEEQWVVDETYAGDAGAPGFAADQARLALGEPVGYVIGWQPFLGLKIYLDSHPLIPRPETEWWVEQLVAVMKKVWPSQARRPEDFLKGGHELRVLDLCSGSGAIGCAMLAALVHADVSFGEIDGAHEATIRKNIRVNDLDESHAHIGIGDLFEPFGDMQFDLIAANPPYVPEGRMLPASVSEYEPSLALYAGADGLALIRRIAEALPAHLAPSGEAWIECDAEHAEAARDAFSHPAMRAEIMHDQYERLRVVKVSWA